MLLAINRYTGANNIKNKIVNYFENLLINELNFSWIFCGSDKVIFYPSVSKGFCRTQDNRCKYTKSNKIKFLCMG